MVDSKSGIAGSKGIDLFFSKILGTSCQFAFHICCILEYTPNSSCQNSQNKFIAMSFGRNGNKLVQETKKMVHLKI